MTDVDDQISEIIQKFNFVRVQTAMLALNWHWAMAGGMVPTTPMLKEAARDLLKTAIDEYINLSPERKAGGYFVSSGGLTAEVIPYEDSVSLQLSFRVEEAEAEFTIIKD